MKPRILAIDIGTSSTKGLLIDSVGVIQAEHAVSYALSSPSPGVAEQDPDEIFAAVQRVIAELGAGGVGLPVEFCYSPAQLTGGTEWRLWPLHRVPSPDHPWRARSAA